VDVGACCLCPTCAKILGWKLPELGSANTADRLGTRRTNEGIGFAEEDKQKLLSGPVGLD
jgi:hypothetical protein